MKHIAGVDSRARSIKTRIETPSGNYEEYDGTLFASKIH